MKSWLLAVCLLAVACDASLAPCAGGNCGTQVSARVTFQASVNRKVDLLFVIDDTPAIAPYQAAVATGMADMARTLTESVEQLSLHVGFVRAGRCNAETRGGACGLTTPESFLRSEWCQTVTNAPATFVAAATCLADFGTDNCGPAQPLSLGLEALSGAPRAGWEGFLRSDAYLMIVVVSAEDDASGPLGQPTAVVDLAARAKSLKPDPSYVGVSVIGPGDCAVDDVQGPRLLEFVQQFGSSGLYIGLCSGQQRAAVIRLAESINDRLAPPCVTKVRDTDSATPGVQPDCTVVMTNSNASGGTVSTAIPSCDDSGPPCWSPAAGMCPGGASGYVFDIATLSERDWCFETPGIFTLECLSCADPNDPACTMTSAAR